MIYLDDSTLYVLKHSIPAQAAGIVLPRSDTGPRASRAPPSGAGARRGRGGAPCCSRPRRPGGYARIRFAPHAGAVAPRGGGNCRSLPRKTVSAVSRTRFALISRVNRADGLPAWAVSPPFGCFARKPPAPRRGGRGAPQSPGPSVVTIALPPLVTLSAREGSPTPGCCLQAGGAAATRRPAPPSRDAAVARPLLCHPERSEGSPTSGCHPEPRPSAPTRRPDDAALPRAGHPARRCFTAFNMTRGAGREPGVSAPTGRPGDRRAGVGAPTRFACSRAPRLR